MVARDSVLHLQIEVFGDDWVMENNLTHWQKERMVDLIGLKYFPELRSAQNIPEDVSAVDVAFEEYYPDLRKVIEMIGVQK